MSSSVDLRAEVRRHAAAAGVDLPESALAELAAHLEDLQAAALAKGATAAEANAAAIAAIEESSFSLLRRPGTCGSGRLLARRSEPIPGAGNRWSVNMFHAIRFALRQFRKHPSFALLTLLVLGLGAGAATTVFTIVDSVVLRPLPYAQPDRLVALWDTNYEHGLSHDPISPVNFMDYRELPVFKDAAAWWRPTVNLADPGLEPVRINTIETSANLFEVLGVRPQIGAGFPTGGPLFVSHEHIAVISDRLWRSRYGGDPAVVGRQLKFDGSPYTIVGVMPAKFHYPDDIDVWQRLEWDMSQHSRAAHFMEGVARLADGTSLEQARSACDALARRLQTELAATNKAWAVRLVPLLDDQLGYYRPALIVLFGAVGLLLLIGCLNVASLLLTRALGREREIAVRIALGAAPRQIATLLIAESGVLSIAGGALGVAVSAIALPLIARLTPVSVPRLEEASVSLATLGVALAVVAFTTAFFGGVPLLALRRARLARDLHSGTRGSSRGARRAYSLLVASQVALAFALLMGSALLVRTVASMTRTPTGIDADAVVTTSVQLSSADYRDWRQVAEVHARIL
ncbi:MAG TPA: ABC transporter permease [Thermoanaerobaculia bacterium]|nr:ABC transporter permease [Thermoanaerobaculia bacterium]